MFRGALWIMEKLLLATLRSRDFSLLCRISRIFNASKRTAKRPSFISPQSQLLFCSGLVLVQMVVNVVWFLLEPPEAVYHHPTREDNMLVCKVRIEASDQ